MHTLLIIWMKLAEYPIKSVEVRESGEQHLLGYWSTFVSISFGQLIQL